MEPFEITVDGKILTVVPQADGSFTISDGESLLGTIQPITSDNMETDWVSADLIAKDYAQLIGTTIEEREM